VHVLLVGTGGGRGWPEEGCRCASCLRATSEGLCRRPALVLVDGTIAVSASQPIGTETGPPAASAHRVTRLPGGFEITGPDGGRLLLAAGPGQVPQPRPDSAPYDIALLDLLADPAQLGLLRRTGLVQDLTIVAAMFADHRVRSEREFARRCALWGVTPGQDGLQLRSTEDRSARASAQRTLIIGGARSGKSTEAELRLAAEPAVTYLAAGPWASGTGPGGEPDTEWADRVARHRARRPSWWQTVESLDIAGWLRRESGVVLIDGFGTWLAGIMDEAGMWEPGLAGEPGSVAERSQADPARVVQAQVDDLIDAWRQTSARVVAVTDQVGSGLVPPYPAGRVFRDHLGWLNQRLAAQSEESLLVVAGRVLALPD
jgi:adenosylcobinamide kinase / adenosylcobinamide-phosphate guanylyltransferase